MNKTITAEILQECLDIHKDRDKQYGSSEKSFKEIADIANSLLMEEGSRTATDIAICMIATKLHRYQFAIQNTDLPNREKVIHDSLIDCINYLAIMENIRINRNNKKF